MPSCDLLVTAIKRVNVNSLSKQTLNIGKLFYALVSLNKSQNLTASARKMKPELVTER